VVPKGRLNHGRTAEQIALQEAWEEAGLIGRLRPQPVGSYRYEKAGRKYSVVTFLMDVTTVVKDWPECEWRSRYWLLPAEAAVGVRKPGLRRLIGRLLDIATENHPTNITGGKISGRKVCFSRAKSGSRYRP
jgi:8-oxo-dGTP pyrophosphatase MutT (NUDIX family)